MPTNTPYKDELIRVALLIGEPEDTDLETLSERVDLKLRALTATPAPANRGADALDALATELETRRERSPGRGFADMTELAQRAREQAAALRNAG